MRSPLLSLTIPLTVRSRAVGQSYVRYVVIYHFSLGNPLFQMGNFIVQYLNTTDRRTNTIDIYTTTATSAASPLPRPNNNNSNSNEKLNHKHPLQKLIFVYDDIFSTRLSTITVHVQKFRFILLIFFTSSLLWPFLSHSVAHSTSFLLSVFFLLRILISQLQ